MSTTEHGPIVMELVNVARAAEAALDPKRSNDPVQNTRRSVAVYDLVSELNKTTYGQGAQAEAARLLGVSRTVVNRHVLKAMERASLPGITPRPARSVVDAVARREQRERTRRERAIETTAREAERERLRQARQASIDAHRAERSRVVAERRAVKAAELVARREERERARQERVANAWVLYREREERRLKRREEIGVERAQLEERKRVRLELDHDILTTFAMVYAEQPYGAITRTAEIHGVSPASVGKRVRRMRSTRSA
jgi:hypothetical protein